MKLDHIVNEMDQFFEIERYGLDPQMKLFVPDCYERIGFDWKNFFEPDFVRILNGLMLRGAADVQNIYCCSFPANDVVAQFLERGKPGDMLFTHHALEFNCGDPRGAFGNGWQPLAPQLLYALKERGLSLYSVHGPLDYHRQVGTVVALIAAFGAQFIEDIHFDGVGYHGAICTFQPCYAEELQDKLLEMFHIPYLDLSGKLGRRLEKVAIIAGGADNLDLLHRIEEKGCDGVIAGEIFSRMTTDFGKQNNPKIVDFVDTTSMALIAVSHSASEFLPMETHVRPWLKEQFQVNVECIPQPKWWR